MNSKMTKSKPARIPLNFPAVKFLFLLAAITALAPSSAYCENEAKTGIETEVEAEAGIETETEAEAETETEAAPKTITITVTGITDYTGPAMLVLIEDLNTFSVVASGYGETIGEIAEFTMRADEAMAADWNGSGSYFIVFVGGVPDIWVKIYTNGETDTDIIEADINNYKYDITEANTTIPFSKFIFTF